MAQNPASWIEEFQAAMDNDLDTPRAVEVMLGLAGEIIEAAEMGGDVGNAQEVLLEMGKVFGMRIGEVVEARVSEGWGVHMGRFGEM